MDIAWLILDSLSFDATPFNARSTSGENTMPELSALVNKFGAVYTNAYVPGPSSPSSHGSFFTGEPPSVTGMHEAFPYFENNVKTIGEILSLTHRSMLVSANPYIFNGLQKGFDVTNDLREEEYMVFSDARNPAEFMKTHDYDNKIRRYFKYISTSSKPIRSIVNGIKYRNVMRERRSSIPESSSRDQNRFQYANEMNARIREFLAESDEDTFVVANYMDIHPPLDASDEALELFCSDYSREEIPIGIRGQDVYEQFRDGDKVIAEKMSALLRAAIWDTDRKVASLVESLLDRDAFVVVTADHGTWFKRETELDEERIHVPLLIFAPDATPQKIDHTVNLQSLPKTTLAALNRSDAEQFKGRDLLDIDEDTVSVTEFIYNADEKGTPVNPTGDETENIRFDMAAVRGEDRVDYIAGDYVTQRGENHDELREEIEVRLSNAPEGSYREIQYDEEVRQRLKDFGYL
ncbi:sulfatase-like hydrolase/transferase [Halobellus marinus]|uniref:sulfatase-like hydrolase/transferase n=1 Tax=Halobellus TaxID=1073986 RepID=UPI0028A7893D|nr:sulfatase-like hydrolase/transferase [Halobellus sp. DFY28]